MKTPVDTLFEELEPPPGGAGRLRRRLEREPHRRRLRLSALAAACALALASLLARPEARSRAPFAMPEGVEPSLVSLGLQPLPREPALIPPEQRHRMALRRVHLDTDRVVFYELAIVPGDPGERSDGAEPPSGLP